MSTDVLLPMGKLTPREQDITELVSQGLANKEIADRLGTKEHTVKQQIYLIFPKVGAKNRAHLVAICNLVSFNINRR
jgi:DNA-binding CsgD family transcriptional regulator